MSRQVTNKKYEEFWNNKELDIKSNEEINNENKKTKKRQSMPRKKVENTIKEETVVNQSSDIESTIVKSHEEQPIKTLKEIYEQYVIDGQSYRIYLRGQIIFDSIKHKINPIFYEDYFILFGNKYIYKGIRFEKY